MHKEFIKQLEANIENKQEILVLQKETMTSLSQKHDLQEKRLSVLVQEIFELKQQLQIAVEAHTKNMESLAKAHNDCQTFKNKVEVLKHSAANRTGQAL